MPTELSETDVAAILGHVVAWQFPSNNMPLHAVRAALESAGLPTALAKDLRPASAFSRAAKGLKDKRQIDRVRTDKGIIRFQLTSKVNTGDEIEFDRETDIALNSETGVITCPNSVIEQQARDLFAAAMETRTNNDCTRLVQELFRDNADLFPLIPEKGVAYFVPVEHSLFLAKVKQFAENCGGALYPFPVPKGTATGNASVRDTIAAGLGAMIAELNATVAEWDDTTRASTEDKAVKRWESITYKTEAYSVYLDAERDKLTAALTAAKAALTAKILDVAKMKEDKKTEAMPTDIFDITEADLLGHIIAAGPVVF